MCLRIQFITSDAVIGHFGARLLPELDKKMDRDYAHAQLRKMEVVEFCRYMYSHLALIDMRGVVDWVAAEGKGMYYREL